jgi:hypothetical protein
MSGSAVANDRLMMLMWWISGPRRMRARRTCQYACFPAPKTVIECTFDLLANSIVAANPVRKAVSSSAFTKPRGAPALSRRVRQPRGVVVWALVCDGFGLKVEAADARVLTLLLGEAVEAFGFGTEARDTILIPVVVPVRAGIKRVVCPGPLSIDIRCGWFALQHAEVSCVPVE